MLKRKVNLAAGTFAVEDVIQVEVRQTRYSEASRPFSTTHGAVPK
jgi:hypothetical protein